MSEEMEMHEDDEVKVEEGEVVMSSGEIDPRTGVLMSTKDVEEKRDANKNGDWREQL